jgi:tetratricopeptide (TPR) repeat protein/tRNA A-37 threonylcarbamoyl transferase component Bud32
MATERSTGDVVALPLARTDAPTLGDAEERARPNDGPMPRKIGRYVVLEVVGKGGMGVVCTAYDPKLDRRIALKLLRENDVSDARRTTTGQARLVREARALARLSHPNIVMVHDVDVVDGRLYIAMEYLEGQSVAQWLDARKRSWLEIVDVLAQAARGLAAAHEAGIVHRDFKPANVLLGPGGRVCVVDFGLAKRSTEDEVQFGTDEHAAVGSIDDSAKLTQVGRRVGTPAYMAPEQMLGQTVGPKADQFAFGVSLYEALYRIAPFRGHVSAPPRDHDVPGWLHRVVLRCLAREPDARYADMHAVIRALQDDPARRRGRIRGAAIAGAVLVLTGVGVGVFGMRPEPCPGADDRVAAIWDPARADALRGAFAATGVPFAETAWSRTSTAVDDHTAEWLRSHVAICRATVRGEQSEALLDTRMACLDRNLHELEVLLDVFASPDVPLVERATEASLRLSDPARCGELASDDDDIDLDPANATKAADIGKRVSAAMAHLLAGRDKAALEIAEDAWHRAQSLGHGPLEDRARLVRSRARARTNDSEGAEEDLRAAIEHAAAIGRAREEAQAWVLLVPLLAHGRVRVDEALALRLAADAALHRAGDPTDLRADLAHGVAMAQLAKGDHEGAIMEFERALELRLEVLDEHHPDVARTRGDLAVALVRSGDYERAEEELLRTIADSEAGLGADHPVVASFAHNLGNVRLEGRGDLAGATAMYERAIAIREAAFGRDSPKVAEVLVSLSALRRHTGDDEAALVTGQRAVEILEAGARKPDPKLGAALNSLGVSLFAMRRYDEALGAHDRALAILRTLNGDEHASVGRTRVRRCEVLGALGQGGEALAECDRAIAIFAKVHHGPHREAADALRMAANVELVHGDPPQAIEHARTAVAMERDLQRPHDDRATAELELLRVLVRDPAAREEVARMRRSLESALPDHPDRSFVTDARAWLREHP